MALRKSKIHYRPKPEENDMAQRRTKPKKSQVPFPEVMTLPEASAYLRLAEKEVVHLIHTQGLPGRFAAGEWRFLKSAVQQWLASGTPTPEARKAAQLAAIGAWKNDPNLETMVEEIYRQRGRPITEDAPTNCFTG
jgi:hypothetical protein